MMSDREALGRLLFRSTHGISGDVRSANIERLAEKIIRSRWLESQISAAKDAGRREGLEEAACVALSLSTYGLVTPDDGSADARGRHIAERVRARAEQV